MSPGRGETGATGLVVVDKPGAMTSHDVVARVRRLVGTRKVGHAGTLDPMATGVLVLGVGRGTRLLGHLALTDKTYLATIRLGVGTTTDDAEGEVVTRGDTSRLDDARVREAVRPFVGALAQVPSSVSAVKVGGRRAYDLARRGEQVELAARPVTVHRFDVLAVRSADADGVGVLDVDVEVHCSTGTYVRALARDLGAALGTGGHLTRLRRTTVGPVDLEEATDLAAALETGHLPVVPWEQAVPRFFPCLTLDESQARDVTHGRALAVRLPAGQGAPVALLGPGGGFLALYRQDADAPAGEPRATPVAVFV